MQQEESTVSMTPRGARNVIVTCAVTGAVHVPSQSPYLPISPEQIAENAIGAAEAGAAILHPHPRNPENGRPTPDPEMFMRFLPEIKERTDAVVNITTGGGQGMTLEQRLAAAMRARPEMCSLNMGSMNFGRFPIAKRIKEWKYDWEAADLESSRDYIFRNTYQDIAFILRELGETHGVKFEYECYDVGHL